MGSQPSNGTQNIQQGDQNLKIDQNSNEVDEDMQRASQQLNLAFGEIAKSLDQLDNHLQTILQNREEAKKLIESQAQRN